MFQSQELVILLFFNATMLYVKNSCSNCLNDIRLRLRSLAAYRFHELWGKTEFCISCLSALSVAGRRDGLNKEIQGLSINLISSAHCSHE